MKWLLLHLFEFKNPPIRINFNLVSTYWWNGTTTTIVLIDGKTYLVLETPKEIDLQLKPSIVAPNIKEG